MRAGSRPQRRLPSSPRLLLSCALALGVVAGRCGQSAAAPPVSSGPAASFPQGPCRPDPLAGVYSPDRLRLLSRCRAIVGTVTGPETSGDGDATFGLVPDPAFATMLNPRNRQLGYLEMEIVPADQLGCGAAGRRVQPVAGFAQTDLGACTGANVRLPRAGAHVRAIGALVLDQGNHWYELHPVWSITLVPR